MAGISMVVADNSSKNCVVNKAGKSRDINMNDGKSLIDEEASLKSPTKSLKSRSSSLKKKRKSISNILFVDLTSDHVEDQVVMKPLVKIPWLEQYNNRDLKRNIVKPDVTLEDLIGQLAVSQICAEDKMDSSVKCRIDSSFEDQTPPEDSTKTMEHSKVEEESILELSPLEEKPWKKNNPPLAVLETTNHLLDVSCTESQCSSKESKTCVQIFLKTDLDKPVTETKSEYLDEEAENCNTKQNYFEDSFYGNIDGLTLLARVSEDASNRIANQKKLDRENQKKIKVKDNLTMKKPPFESPDIDKTPVNRIIGIVPEDVDKVGLQVEIASPNDNVELNDPNTNVILNGETVVLLQKSPNSNLYIINKAVENKMEDEMKNEERLLNEEYLLEVREAADQDLKCNLKIEDSILDMSNRNSYRYQDLQHDYRVPNYTLQQYPSMRETTIPLHLYPPTSDYYVCKHCNRNVPVNPNPACAHEVMAQCRHVILPSNEPLIDSNSYYLSPQPQPSKERTNDDLYKDPYLYEMGTEKMESMKEVGYKPGGTPSELSINMLPLKKRMKAMFSASIAENRENYPRSPIMSISHIGSPINSHNEASNAAHFTEAEKSRDAMEKSGKKAKKVSDAKKTRCSQRKVPKVNYSYSDGDPEWSPSEEAKRKRKKANR